MLDTSWHANMQYIKQLMLGVSCLLMLSAQAEQPSLEVATSDALRVGMFTDFPPLVFLVSGEIQGIEVDLARLLSEQLGRPLAIKTYKFHELIPALEADEIDIIMSGLSITEERKQQVSYAKPYMHVGQMAIVRIEDASVYGKTNALMTDKIKIGVHAGTTGEAFARENYKSAELKPYPGVEAGLAGLRQGDIDVFLHDSTTSWQLSRSFINDNLLSLNRLLTKESIAWALNKKDKDLLSAVNLTLEKLKSEGKVSEAIERWLPIVPTTSAN